MHKSRNARPRSRKQQLFAMLVAAVLVLTGLQFFGADRAEAQEQVPVAWIQQAVLQAKCSVGPHGVDGVYGPATREGVRCYQNRYGLRVDGVVGPQTTRSMQQVMSTSEWETVAKPVAAKPAKPTKPALVKAPGPVLGPPVPTAVPTNTYLHDGPKYDDVELRTYFSMADVDKYRIHMADGAATFVAAFCGKWPNLMAQGVCALTIVAHFGPVRQAFIRAQINDTCVLMRWLPKDGGFFNINAKPLVVTDQTPCLMTDGKRTWAA